MNQDRSRDPGGMGVACPIWRQALVEKWSRLPRFPAERRPAQKNRGACRSIDGEYEGELKKRRGGQLADVGKGSRARSKF
jgi:hypothetical protein